MLIVSMLMVKIIGALFKIPLTTMLGGIGMGYFMTAYGLFNPIYSLSVAGFPVAVSKMVSGFVAKGQSGDAGRAARVALVLFSDIGLILSTGIFLGADLFAEAVGNPKSAWAVKVIVPALFFGCISASVRGYYEGHRNMAPTAVAQTLEALVKLGAGIGLAYYVLDRARYEFAAMGTVFGTVMGDAQQAELAALPAAAAAAVVGVVFSTAVGACFLMLRRLIGGRLSEPKSRPTQGYGAIAGQLLLMAFPIALSALAVNITGIIDLISVMNRLDSAARTGLQLLLDSHKGAIPGYLGRGDIAGFLYGSYTGMAMTIFNIVPAFTTAFGTSALPVISGYWINGRQAQLRRTVESVIRISAMIAIPAGLGICALSEPILSFLFRSSPSEVAVSAPLMSVMGIAVIFVALTPPINSMLQAVGGVYYPVRFMFMGATMKLISNAVLVSIPAVNIKGAPIGTLLCYGFTFAAGLISLCSLTGASIGIGHTFLKPLAAGLVCAVSAQVAFDTFFRLTGSYSMVVPAVAFGGIIYLIFILLTKTIKKDDLIDIKNGHKVALLLAKYGFLG